MLEAYDLDPPGLLTFNTNNWEETLGQTQNLLGGFQISSELYKMYD